MRGCIQLISKARKGDGGCQSVVEKNNYSRNVAISTGKGKRELRNLISSVNNDGR